MQLAQPWKTFSEENETESKLTRLQAALRSYLRANSGETLTRERLCADVWGMNYYQSSRTIDQTVSVVRKHLAPHEQIVTVFGIGYRHESAANNSCLAAARFCDDELGRMSR